MKLDDRHSIPSKDFEKINWLPVSDRISQCSLSSVYKFFSKSFPDYFDELYFPAEVTGVRTRSSYQKLNLPRRKTNIGVQAVSYVGPSLWNSLDETIKTSNSVNSFKHKMKEYYFSKLM